MNAYTFVVIAALALVGFAVYKKDCVRASLRLRSFWFFLEATNNKKTGKRRIGSSKSDPAHPIESRKLESPRNI